MKLSDLDESTKRVIADYPLDSLEMKHELSHWESRIFEHSTSFFDKDGNEEVITYGGDVEFMNIDGKHVLLPVPKINHGNITIHQCFLSQQEQLVTLFLKDSTHTPEGDNSYIIAVCEKVKEHEWFLCTLYHATYHECLRTDEGVL